MNRTKYAILKIMFHMLFGLLFACTAAVIYMSKSDFFQKRMVQKLEEQFAKKYNCRLECTMKQFDWTTLQVTFAGVTIVPINKESWSMYAETLMVHVSWWSLLTTFSIKLSGSFDKLVMHEQFYDHPSGLSKFMMKVFATGESSWIQYDHLSISNGLLLLEQNDNSVTMHIPFVCNMSQERDALRMQLYSLKGVLSSYQKTIFEDISGTIVCSLPYEHRLSTMSMNMNVTMNIPGLQEKGSSFLVGSLDRGRGECSFSNQDQTITMRPCTMKVNHAHWWLYFTLQTSADLCKQLMLSELCKDIRGEVQIEGKVDLFDIARTYQSDLLVKNVMYKNKQLLSHGGVSVGYAFDRVWKGSVQGAAGSLFDAVVKKKKKGTSVTIKNVCDFTLSSDTYWKIKKDECNIKLLYASDKKWSGSYDATLFNTKLNEQKNIFGTFYVSENILYLHGDVDSTTYAVSIALSPSPYLISLQCKKGEQQLIDFHIDKEDNNRLVGTVNFAFIRTLISDRYKSSFAQDGEVEFQGQIKDGIYYSEITTKRAHIRIPKMYNVIQDVKATCEINMYDRSIILKDVIAELYEGSINCKQATFMFDKAFCFSFIHAPLFLKEVMFSWDKGIFMLLSGRLFLQKQIDELMTLEGKLIIEKSQLKGNIFSKEFQEKLFGNIVAYDDKELFSRDCNLDVSVFTKDLLQIKTASLEAQAKVDVSLLGTMKKPDISGSLELYSGSFYFPYKSLEIMSGKLFFVSGQHLDPLIEMMAKGKLKRHAVTMRVNGSALHPTVQFEAVPYLTEEQIISLLLLGIEDSSLSMMVPALLTQKLKDIMFGPALSKTKLKSSYDRILESLKYFRFLPQFTNQAGRGGMRGIFEIDASDNLHGRIDTNFMQLEDTKFDIDYSVTDDVTLRVQKDGPSTYGGEVEFRWKFS